MAKSDETDHHNLAPSLNISVKLTSMKHALCYGRTVPAATHASYQILPLEKELVVNTTVL